MKKTLGLFLLVLIMNGCKKPTSACFVYSPTTVTTATTVTFDASCSEEADTYQWNFNDGFLPTPPSSSPIVDHAFLNPGTYSVTLTVERSGRKKRKETLTTSQIVIVQ